MAEASQLVPIGRFDVMARREHVVAFCAAIDRAGGDPAPTGAQLAVPATYPVSWLTRPDIRNAIRTIPFFALGLCIQLSQTVSSRRPIEMDVPYRMDVGWRRLDEARRTFEVHATVSDGTDEPILSMRSALMIAPHQGGGA